MPQEFGSIFIATCFCPACRARAERLADLIGEWEINCVFGEDLGGHQDIPGGVQARLRDAALCIAILSRKESLGDGVWAPPRWVVDEAVCALHGQKPLILLAESGVEVTGMLRHREQLVFEPGRGFEDELILHVVRQIKTALGKWGLTIGLKETGRGRAAPQVVAHVSDEPLGDDCNDAAKRLIEDVRRLSAEGLYDEALVLARRAAALDAECWRAHTSVGALLAKTGRLEEAKAVYEETLLRFPRHNRARACALSNLAALLEAEAWRNPSPESLAAQRLLLEESIRLDPGRIHTRASLAIVLTLLGETEAAVELLGDSLAFPKFREAFKFELETRGLVVRVLSKLPRWVEQFLYSVSRGDAHGD